MIYIEYSIKYKRTKLVFKGSPFGRKIYKTFLVSYKTPDTPELFYKEKEYLTPLRGYETI